MQQAAMQYGGYMTGVFAEGGEPNGSMALGQMSAVADKMSKLRQFVSPEQNVDPWIASKLAVIDDSTAAIADYMMYNPEAQGGGEEEGEEYEQEDMEEMMANGGYVVTRSNDRKGKTHKVTGPDGTVKYFGDSKLRQHPKDPERQKAFYARHKKNLANNPFFRAFARKTWKEGGSTFSGNAWYQEGGSSVTPLVPYSNEYMNALANDYKNLYSNKPPFLPIQKDDGYDAFYHSKYDRLPDTKRIASGWITTLKNAQPGDDTFEFTEDNGETSAPKANKNKIVKRVENHVVSERPVSDYPRITHHLQNQLYKPGMNFLNLYQDGGGFIPEVMPFPADYAVEMMMKQGGIYIDPKKKGTFKAQATRMGMGVQEAASAILNAPEGKYSPAMRKKANFAKNFAKQMGGPVEGEVLDVSPEQLEALRQQGYEFEIM